MTWPQSAADGVPFAVTMLASAASATAGVVIDPVVTWAGVPLQVVLWSFAGAACAISFLPTMTTGRAMVALATGTLLAIAVEPLAVLAMGLPEGKYDIGVAAVLGLLMQVLVGALFGSVPSAVQDLVRAVVDRVRR